MLSKAHRAGATHHRQHTYPSFFLHRGTLYQRTHLGLRGVQARVGLSTARGGVTCLSPP